MYNIIKSICNYYQINSKRFDATNIIKYQRIYTENIIQKKLQNFCINFYLCNTLAYSRPTFVPETRNKRLLNNIKTLIKTKKRRKLWEQFLQ